MVTYWHLGPYLHYHMSYSLNSLKWSYIGDYIGIIIGDIKGDTRSLDYGSYGLGGDYMQYYPPPKKIDGGLCRDLGFGSCSGSPGRLVLGLGAGGVGFGWGGPVEP